MKIDTPDLDTNEFDKFIEIERNIWKNTKIGKFVFEDETQGFSSDYNTIRECREALNRYCIEFLGVNPNAQSN